jgi:hypothetical protein
MVGHGPFGRIVEAELNGLTYRTARNFMDAFQAFRDKSEIISHLSVDGRD